jgi:choline transport protein
MVAVKEPVSSTEEYPVDPENANLPTEKAGTKSDQRDMWRMGKAQEMRRNFRFVSIFGFTMLVMCSWETMLGTSIIGLINGGTAGLIVSRAHQFAKVVC